MQKNELNTQLKEYNNEWKKKRDKEDLEKKEKYYLNI